MHHKTSKRIIAFLILAILLVVSLPLSGFAASSPLKGVCVKKAGMVFPNIIGLGAKDIITFDINNKSKIVDINVRQQGGSMLGLINVTPKGFEIKASQNIILTYWALEVSMPFKIFNLSRQISSKCMMYTLSNTGAVTMKKLYGK